jgi:predicted site-specific integrase-resolvase
MTKILTPKELCERWKVSESVLRHWRVKDAGPSYIKLGENRNSEVRYRLEDIEAFEKSNRYTTNK